MQKSDESCQCFPKFFPKAFGLPAATAYPDAVQMG